MITINLDIHLGSFEARNICDDLDGSVGFLLNIQIESGRGKNGGYALLEAHSTRRVDVW